jgi:hypothetical protein
MFKRTFAALVISAAALVGCGELEEAREVTGNFEVRYVDNLRVYIGDELVAEVVSGEDAEIEYSGEYFTVSTLCGEEGTTCPSEAYWREVAVDQPWGADNSLLNFVNLDPEYGVAGQRMGGLLDAAGGFTMLSGLALDGNGNCAVLGVGTVTGQFADDNASISDGVIAFEWAGGCQVGEVTLATSLRIETDYTAIRTGDYDVSSVSPAPPIDEEGEELEPIEASSTPL